MKTISLKLENSFLKEIDKNLIKNRYGTRTEFIREAIRDKLSTFEKGELIKNLSRLRGTSKLKTTDEQLNKVRKKLAKKLFNI